VNKQNWRNWGSENLHLSIAKPLHSASVSVWCAISPSGIIGPYYFDKTVNAIEYKKVLETFFIPTAIGQCKVDKFWFQQEGARPHRTQDVFDFISEHFGTRIIALDAKRLGDGGIE